MEWFKKQPIATQTAFAQLLQTTLQVFSGQSLAGLKGNFSSRVVKGKTYWYYRFRDTAGIDQQIYVGPDSESIHELVKRKQDGAIKAQLQAVQRQIRMAVSAGAQMTPTYHLKLIRQLSDSGFFYAGGLLIGSHAFAAYANMLGIKWVGDSFVRTLDVDFAHAGSNLSVALPSTIKIDTSDAIQSLEEGFIPQITPTGRGGTWSHPSDPDYLIDFLTTQTSDSQAPYEDERLGIALQPLRFMEFSMESVQQTVIFDRSTAVIVNVPDPARYAIHKLIIYGERTGANQIKAQKDLMQAAALIAILSTDRPLDLYAAWSDATERGPGWRQRIDHGVKALNEAYPENGFLKFIDGYIAEHRKPSSTIPRWR